MGLFAKKHNGFITRLNNGQSEEVISNIDRLVEHSIQTVNDSGKSVFMDMRYKRDRGQYHIVYEIEDDLCDLDTNISIFYMSYFMWGTKRVR